MQKLQAYGFSFVLMFSATASQAAVSLVEIDSIVSHGTNGNSNGSIGRLTEFVAGTVGVNGTSGATGITKTDPADPTTWIHGSNWQEGWQASKTSGSNIGWVVMDLGAATTNLSELLIWNVTEGGAGPQSRGVATFNLWYTDTPTTAVPGSGAYTFNTASGWTQLGGVNSLAIGGTTGALTDSFDLSAISSTRYLAIEILTNYGSSTTGVDNTVNRVGLAELIVTQVPEPSSLLLLAFSALGLSLRRNVRA